MGIREGLIYSMERKCRGVRDEGIIRKTDENGKRQGKGIKYEEEKQQHRFTKLGRKVDRNMKDTEQKCMQKKKESNDM